MSNCLRLWKVSVSTNKKETPLSPRAVRRSAADRRTDYEGAGGKKEFQWLPGIKSNTNRLDKNGGLGSPQRFLVTFVRTKVTRVRGGEPREYRPSARGATAEVRQRTAPVTRYPEVKRKFSGNWVSLMKLSG